MFLSIVQFSLFYIWCCVNFLWSVSDIYVHKSITVIIYFFAFLLLNNYFRILSVLLMLFISIFFLYVNHGWLYNLMQMKRTTDHMFFRFSILYFFNWFLFLKRYIILSSVIGLYVVMFFEYFVFQNNLPKKIKKFFFRNRKFEGVKGKMKEGFFEKYILDYF
jgi:hypothetical protein